MLSTLLVIGGVLVGLLVLLALIVSLSARPSCRPRADLVHTCVTGGTGVGVQRRVLRNRPMIFGGM